MKPKRIVLSALYCALLVVLLSSLSSAEVIKDQVKCHTTWDDHYFYFAFKVDCPDVQATHSQPNAPVDGDDAIEVLIETDNLHSESLTPRCFSMIVSAAQGAQFKEGTADGGFKPVEVFTFKYSATVQGTLNNSDDVDMGYTVELALPWDILKMEPPAMGKMISFNVLVHRHGEEEADFVSLAPDVEAEQDAYSPAKWSNLVFTNYSFVAATISVDKIVSAKYIARMPVINGSTHDKEWNNNTAFFIDLPMKEGHVYEAKFPVQQMILTPYFYWHQADKRKAAPVCGILHPEGGYVFQDFPAKNVGPWVSYDRVQWHKDELSDVVTAGIDVVLPVYWGDKGNRGSFSRKGLDCLVSALNELRSEGRAYPLVGMYLDTNSLHVVYNQAPNLKEEEVMRTFYGMIKDFYDRIPAEYRAVAQADKPNAGRAGNIVFLYKSSMFSDLDSTFIQYCNQRFEQDFGVPLIWIGDEDYKGKVEGLDGFASHGECGKLRYDETGRIRISCVGAGYNTSAAKDPEETVIISRMGGETYDKDWQSAIENQPHWVLCDSWNAFPVGSDLCASRQYGRKYIDATAANVRKFRGNREFDAAYLSYDIPKVIGPKQFAQAQLVIRNIGNSPWRVSEGVAVGYRWYKNGRYYGESKIRRPLERDVMPGETVTVNVGIATVNSNGDEVPEGDSEIRFELIRMADGKWFSSLGDQPLYVPVTIGEPFEWAASYLSCDAPVLMASNADYDVIIRVRNDGSAIWRKGVTKLGVRLFKISNYLYDGQDIVDEEVPIRDVRVLLEKDCKPGEIAEFVFKLKLSQPNGQPIPSWNQSDDWSYQLRYDLFNGKEWLSDLGIPTLKRVVDIFDTDYGPRVVDCDIPSKLEAGKTYDTRVVIRNNGVVAWDRKRTSLGYHWYHLDGTEALWDGIATPISANVQPGMALVTTAKVKTPEYDGRYVLVLDVQIDGVWQSTQPITRGGDVLPLVVEVTGGRLRFVDLSSLYDSSMSSPDTDRSIGDFDGKGYSFPAEFLPPDTGAGEDMLPLYPSGYNWNRLDNEKSRISFLFPVEGKASAITCNGQKVLVDSGRYLQLHVLGASIEEDTSGKFSLNYTDGAELAELTFSDWTATPGTDDWVACGTHHRHSHGGDEIEKNCHLYHYLIHLDSSRTLTSVTLPKNDKMRVVAFTLERPESVK